MIETKQQVVSVFRAQAHAFLEQPAFTTGIDLDDATVTLKRFVLTEMKDQELASLLGRFAKLIRALDTGALRELVAEVERRLAD